MPEAKVPDRVRIRRAASYFGTRAMVYLAVFAALDAWLVVTDGILIAQVLGVIAGFLTGRFLAGVFHEWGHFAGARFLGAYSPVVPEPKGAFFFGFDNARNSPQQFMAMSLGGSVGNWLLVLLVALLLPLDNIARVALLATVFGRAVGVLVFEGPIMLGVSRGGEPQAELDRRIGAGGLDVGRAQGYVATGVAFVAGLVYV